MPAWVQQLERSTQAVAVLIDTGHLWANDAYVTLTGRTRRWLEGHGLTDVVAAGDAAVVQAADRSLASDGSSAAVKLARVTLPGGEARWVSLTMTRLPAPADTHERGPLLVTGWDLTDEREAQEQLRHRATHDRLTGLPNRALFLEHLEHALARLARRAEGCVAVLFIDLDRVKHINDAYGHAAGDQLLVQVGERLRRALRPQDVLARLGGDEFTVLLEDVCDPAQVHAIAQRCLTLLAADQHPIDGDNLRLTASIGVAIGDAQAKPADLLAAADTAMYEAKKAGRNRVALIDAAQAPHLSPRAMLERQLAGAVDRGELEVYYQPIFDLTTGRITAGEALLRWNHPTHGLLTAGEFVDVAEEAGLISGIGDWVCDTVIADLAGWDATGTAIGQVYLNIAVQQLDNGTFVNHLARALTRHGASADRLCLEITETEIMSSSATMAHLQALHELGCSLVVDDFGTGYSSLSRLVDLPVDVVKIDRSFIAGVGLDPRPTAVVSATLLLTHDLRQDSIAEGVETQQQHRWLIEAGCTHAQGFLLAKPMPSPAFIDLTARTNHLP